MNEFRFLFLRLFDLSVELEHQFTAKLPAKLTCQTKLILTLRTSRSTFEVYELCFVQQSVLLLSFNPTAEVCWVLSALR